MSETTSRAAARTANPLPFFSCDAGRSTLFSINAGVPFDTLLDYAQCFMHSVESAVLNAAESADNQDAWSAYYLVQSAGALIEAMQSALAEENRHV